MLEGDALAHWLAERAGCLTASRMSDVLAVSKRDGKPLKARLDYAMQLLAERETGLSCRHFVNDAMQFGLENEDEAKHAYEAETGEFIRPAAFYRHARIEYFGATPDGLLGDDGLIETKVPQSTTFLGWRMAGVVPEEHEPQMLAQLACTGRKWVEFVAYDPRVKNPARRLFIRRYEPAPEAIAAVEAEAEKFLKEVEAMWERLLS